MMLNPNKMAQGMLDKLTTGAVGDLKGVLESIHAHLEHQLETQREILDHLKAMNEANNVKVVLTSYNDDKQDPTNN